MNRNKLPLRRVKQLLTAARQRHVLVVGDVMLDQFIWGSVARISPEAPVPVVDFQRENFMPGGAANVARNLTALGSQTELFGAVGADSSAASLKSLLASQHVGCAGLVTVHGRATTLKTRIVASQQQVVRIDRETRGELDAPTCGRLLSSTAKNIKEADAVIVGDYGKGVVTQSLLNELRALCRSHGKWLSLDPKPIHHLNLSNLSLITPNRKEAFELANLEDDTRHCDPFKDTKLMRVSELLLNELRPAVLLITLGELGMLLCQRGHRAVHIPTVTQEVFDVSGAGDTVISSFTLAVTAGASPVEAAIFANHSAGVVVGKMGTATCSPEELLRSFNGH